MKHKLSTIILVAAALATLWFVFIWMPLSKQISATQTQTKATKAEIADYDLTVAQLPALMQAKAELDGRKRLQRSSLYAKDDMLKLFDQLKLDARQQNLTVASITPPIEELLALNRTVQTSGDPAFLNITMKMRGDYFDFTQFVLQLEKAPYFRGITACRVVDEDDNPDRLQCQIGFRALLGEPEETS